MYRSTYSVPRRFIIASASWHKAIPTLRSPRSSIRRRSPTVKGKLWTPRRVMDFRLSNAIPSGFTTHAELRLPASGYITSAEAAVQLGVSQSTIQKWYKTGRAQRQTRWRTGGAVDSLDRECRRASRRRRDTASTNGFGTLFMPHPKQTTGRSISLGTTERAHDLPASLWDPFAILHLTR